MLRVLSVIILPFQNFSVSSLKGFHRSSGFVNLFKCISQTKQVSCSEMSRADLKIILQDTVVQAFRGEEGGHSWGTRAVVWLCAVPRGPAVLLKVDRRLPPAPNGDRAHNVVLLGGIISAHLSDMIGCCLGRVVWRQTTVWAPQSDGACGVGTRTEYGSTGPTGTQGASHWREQKALHQAGEMKLHVLKTRVKCAQAAQKHWLVNVI